MVLKGLGSRAAEVPRLGDDLEDRLIDTQARETLKKRWTERESPNEEWYASEALRARRDSRGSKKKGLDRRGPTA